MATRPSKSQLDRAGRVLREWLDQMVQRTLDARNSGADPRETIRETITDEVTHAFQTFYDYQASYDDALTVIEAGFSESVRAVHAQSAEEIVGRPKRMASILMKLWKLKVRPAQIEDLWGFRSVLPNQESVYAVLERLRERWPDAHVDDYVERPRASGYRSIHVVVIEDGVRVELQLRTPRQNEWADAVERTGDRLGFNFPGNSLKDGEGPSDLVQYFRLAAYRIALEERGERPPEDLEETFVTLREQVTPYFQRDR